MLPGIAYYLSRWYTKDELVFRLSLYIVCAPLAGAFGGLLASGILTIDSIGSVTTWRLIFLIEGIITAGVGIICYFIMTDRPATAKWLTEEEKELAIARIKTESIGATVVLDKMNKKGIFQGIFAPSTIIISIIFLLNNITVQGVAFFTPTIISSIYPKKTTVQKQLQTVPPYIVGAFFTVLFPYISMKIRRRGVVMMTAAPLMMIGYIMFLASTNPQVRYAATFIVMMGAFPFGALCNGWASINVASDTARASSISAVAMMGNIGGLISTWSALPKDAPNYPILNGLNLGTSTTILCLATGLLLWMKRDNFKRERGDYDYRLEGMTMEESGVLGNQHPGFRYKY
jgi:sugar phosphate permease